MFSLNKANLFTSLMPRSSGNIDVIGFHPFPAIPTTSPDGARVGAEISR